MFGEWLNQGLHYLQMMTASTLLALIVGLYVAGYGLKQMVEQRALLAKSALRLIEALAVGFGFMTGTFMVLIVFVILVPSASDWIVNTYLPKTLIWQTEFQTWLSSQINDSRTATGVGLINSKRMCWSRASIHFIFFRRIFCVVIKYSCSPSFRFSKSALLYFSIMTISHNCVKFKFFLFQNLCNLKRTIRFLYVIIYFI
jgi:hypothetical protein